MSRCDSTLAEVVADLRRGNFRRHPHTDPRLFSLAGDMVTGSVGPLIDATFIYETYMPKGEIAIYEDHPCILPVWTEAFIGYRNEHGNANVTHMVVLPWEEMGKMAWESEHDDQDTSQAKWGFLLFFYCGGKSNGGKVPTFGPVTLTRMAVAEDGTPIDFQWLDLLGDGRAEEFDWHRLTVLGTMNLLNCRNTVLIEAPMARPDRRREQRLGIRSHVISVRPTGKKTPKPGQPPNGDDGVAKPLHSVRGHVSHFGDCCPGKHPPNGLLFGRITGRVFVPQHARGTAEAGSVEQVFVIEDP